MSKMLATLQGLDVPPPRPLEDDAVDETLDAIEALRGRLADTRRLRKAAERDGSYVAAQSLIKLEADIIASIETERRAREAASALNATDDDLLRELEDVMDSLPDALLDALSARIAAKRAPTE
jgi:molecular chaperone GrpE (heat shock protein)